MIEQEILRQLREVRGDVDQLALELRAIRTHDLARWQELSFTLNRQGELNAQLERLISRVVANGDNTEATLALLLRHVTQGTADTREVLVRTRARLPGPTPEPEAAQSVAGEDDTKMSVVLEGSAAQTAADAAEAQRRESETS